MEARISLGNIYMYSLFTHHPIWAGFIPCPQLCYRVLHFQPGCIHNWQRKGIFTFVNNTAHLTIWGYTANQSDFFNALYSTQIDQAEVKMDFYNFFADAICFISLPNSISGDNQHMLFITPKESVMYLTAY